MVRDNGLDPRDPEYNDFGYSDFLSDYVPDDDELDEFIADRCDEVIDWFNKGWSINDVREYWKKENETEIEQEWNEKDSTSEDY